MSTQKSKEGSEYRIELTDIRGVGPKTLDVLESAGIESVAETHILHNMSGRAGSTVRDNVGIDTVKHLKAVGSAVHYGGSDRVRAKHLTGSITDEATFGSSYVDISADRPSDMNTDKDSDPETFDPDMDRLSEAVERIQSEYPEGYGNQVSFEADLGRHINESDRFNSDHKLQTGLVQSLIRHRHTTDRFTAQGDYQPFHGSLLIAFAETLE